MSKNKKPPLVEEPGKLAYGEVPSVCVAEMQAALLLNGASARSVDRLFNQLGNNDTVNLPFGDGTPRQKAADLSSLARATATMKANGEGDPTCRTKVGEKVRFHQGLAKPHKP